MSDLFLSIVGIISLTKYNIVRVIRNEMTKRDHCCHNISLMHGRPFRVGTVSLILCLLALKYNMHFVHIFRLFVCDT